MTRMSDGTEHIASPADPAATPHTVIGPAGDEPVPPPPVDAPRRPPRSPLPLLIGAAILAGLLVVAAIVLVRTGGHRTAPPVAHRRPPTVGKLIPPAVPARGAYVGAWAKPAKFSDDGRRQAIATLERGIGRKLDIVHTYHVWEDPFPSVSDLDFLHRGYLLQLSWAGTQLSSINSGQFDAMIHQRAKAVRAAGKPIFMEWRWEMDRPNLANLGSAADYVAAWRHIKTIFDQEGATNAAWVWCPTAEGFAAGRANAYYPGDKWVDWTCVDAYPGPTWRPMSQLLAPFLSWTQGHPKPIMIGEYGVARDRTPQARAAYLTAAEATFRSHPEIKAVCYFDSNPTGHTSRRQYSVDDDPVALRALALQAANPYFNPQRLRVG